MGKPVRLGILLVLAMVWVQGEVAASRAPDIGVVLSPLQPRVGQELHVTVRTRELSVCVITITGYDEKGRAHVLERPVGDRLVTSSRTWRTQTRLWRRWDRGLVSVLCTHGVMHTRVVRNTIKKKFFVRG